MWCYIVAVTAAVIFLLYSFDIQAVEYSVSLYEKFEGALKVNEKLDSVEKLHEGTLVWPESMAIHDGDIYTGLGDGRIVRLSNEVHYVGRIGKKCEGQHEEHICGRPLGMTFDKNGLLYVVDAYHGLYTMNVKTGKSSALLQSSEKVDGKPLTFLNMVLLDEEDGIVYLSQSSTRWNISHVMFSILEHESSGRLLKFDLKNKVTTVLIEGLAFPNGLEMSHDKQSILIAETNNNKILRYYIRGSQKGKTEDFLLLPGEPDNIRSTKRGSYWVGMSGGRTAATPALHDRLCSYPSIRKGFLHFYNLVTVPLVLVSKLLPSKWFKEFAFECNNGRLMAHMIPVHGLIVEFDANGNIIQSLHSPSGKTGFISEVLEYDEFLYLGSWANNFLGRIKL